MSNIPLLSEHHIEPIWDIFKNREGSVETVGSDRRCSPYFSLSHIRSFHLLTPEQKISREQRYQMGCLKKAEGSYAVCSAFRTERRDVKIAWG
ncbi:MAG: hypothetical protein WBA93_22000 [Microcoleaceae cyanobacterium]